MAFTNENFMREALIEAQKAYQLGEVPVGAVITDGKKIISRAYNLIEKSCDATSHAELLVIKETSKLTKNWRLNDLILYVTLEPCVMCMGAIQNSRISKVVFGAKDKIAGACGSVSDLTYDHRAKKQIDCLGEVLENECAEILKNFFKEQRIKFKI